MTTTGGNGSRPGSLYDNYKETYEEEREKYYYGNDEYERLRNEMLGYERAKSPTQTIALMTTVPQNISAVNIAGRHAPTRNSLRHSRMIVMNKSGPVPSKATPPILRFDRLAKGLVALQALSGIGTCFLAFWIFLWTPNIRNRDNPIWSGIPLFLSGIIGLVLLFRCRKEYPGMKNGHLVYSLKVFSIFLSSVAGTLCVIAVAFGAIHIISITLMGCVSTDLEHNATCMCYLNSSIPLLTKKYHYVDLRCPEVDGSFLGLIVLACCCNIAGCISAFWYVYLHWASRYMYTYSKVHTNELRPTVIRNTS